MRKKHPFAMMPGMRENGWIVFVLAIYLLFAWLAVERPLVPDEIWALTNAEQSVSVQLASVRRDIIHPPLFYFLERGWIAVFGAGDRSIKLLPVLINLPAIALFAILARRVTARWRVALLLFLAVYLHVFSSVNLLGMYGLSVLLAISAVLVWDRWKERQTNGWLALLAAILCLGVMTHFFGVLLVVALVAMDRSKRLLVAAVIPIVLFACWIAFVFPLYLEHGLKANLNWVEPNLARALASVPFHFLTTVPSNNNPVHLDWWETIPLRLALSVIVALLHLLIIPSLYRKRAELWTARLVLLLSVPVVSLAAISLLLPTPAFDSRFLLGLLPFYWLLMTFAFENNRGLAVLCGLAVAATLLPLKYDLQEPPLRHELASVPAGSTVIADFRLGPQAYWELRKRGNFHVAIVPETQYWAQFRFPSELPDHAWLLCQSTCPQIMKARLSDYSVQQAGSHLHRIERSTTSVD